MSLTDMVIMPGADYQDACEAIREKTGGTGYIRSGEMAAQIRGISTGVELPVLTNPASAADIASGKEAIDGEGNLLTGTASIKPEGSVAIRNRSGQSVWVLSENHPSGLEVAAGTNATITEHAGSFYSIFYNRQVQSPDWNNGSAHNRMTLHGTFEILLPEGLATFDAQRIYTMPSAGEWPNAFVLIQSA